MLPANPGGIYNQAGSEDIPFSRAHTTCGDNAAAAVMLGFDRSEERPIC